MTNEDKALVDAMTLAIKESIGKQFNATPIHPDPSIGDWAASGGVIDLRDVAEALLPIISDRIKNLKTENERLLEALEWANNVDPDLVSAILVHAELSAALRGTEQ